ncbi:MAG: VanZ family protein [Cyanobacteriota bacterium]
MSFSSINIPHGYDKILHFMAYFMATIIVSLSFYYVFTNKHWFNYFLIVICILGAIVGAVIEKLQEYYNPIRECETNDWLANITGISIAILVIYLFNIYDNRKKERNRE